MRSEVCGACKFWQEGKGEVGECRRNPPTVHLVTIRRALSDVPEAKPMAAFPPTHAGSWCGQFEEDAGE